MHPQSITAIQPEGGRGEGGGALTMRGCEGHGALVTAGNVSTYRCYQIPGAPVATYQSQSEIS